ncbi:MAG: hypothetical protein KGL52_01685 [Rhodospirillales bacterium]|jgi:lipopolysaccharide export system protein LptA|nr:hypothetical protein [Rhodospirillales bacterium]
MSRRTAGSAAVGERRWPHGPGRTALVLLALLALGRPWVAPPALAQGINLAQGGPIAITARAGITWLRDNREIIARGDARAVRQDVTVTADELIAWYRPKAPAPGAAHPAGSPAGPSPGHAAPPGGETAAIGAPEGGDNEIYRIEALGHVHIFTPTDRATCDRAVYDLDQAVLVMTGHDLRLVTPNEVLTARRDMEYWSAKNMAVARGDAVVVTRDSRRISADVLVAYTTPSAPASAPRSAPAPAGAPTAAGKTAPGGATDPLAASGKLNRVEAFGHVVLRTPTDIVTGDRAVYVPATGRARLVGQVRITRGNNQLAGQAADVDLKSGVATLVASPDARVKGLIVPDQQATKALAAPAADRPSAAPGRTAAAGAASPARSGR